MTDDRFTVDTKALSDWSQGAEVAAALVAAMAPAPAVSPALRDPTIVGLFCPWPWTPERATCVTHGSYPISVFTADGPRFMPGGCPVCREENAIRNILGRCGIPVEFQDRTFDAFNAERCSQAKDALAATRVFAAKFAQHRKAGSCMILHGRMRTGKSHLACAIALAIAGAGYTSAYFTVMQAIRKVREAWAPVPRFSEEELLQSFTRPDLLILEEVGRQSDSQSERNHLFEILDQRYMRRLPTVITSNLALRGAKGIEGMLGAAAFDRLFRNGCKVVEFDWPAWEGEGQ